MSVSKTSPEDEIYKLVPLLDNDTGLPLFTMDGNTLKFQQNLPQWHAIVDYSIRNNRMDDVLFQYGKFRETVVNNLLDECKKGYCEDCNWTSSGSTNLASDYDINVDGEFADLVIKTFNTIFQKRYGQSSAEMFDTNVYGYPRLFNDKEFARLPTFTTVVDKNSHNEYELIKTPTTPMFLTINTHNQHIWALIKFIKCITAVEMPTINKLAYFREPMLYLSQEKIMNSISESNVQYANFLTKVRKSVAAIKHQAQSDRSNITLQTDQMIVKYNQLVSHANSHGVETYFSAGPYLHVVVKSQMKIDIELTRDHYMDSFIENMGFALFHMKRDMDCKEGIVDSSKYLRRAFDAYSHVEVKDKTTKNILTFIEPIYKHRGTKTVPTDLEFTDLFDSIGYKNAINSCEMKFLRRIVFNYTVKCMTMFFGKDHEEDDSVRVAHISAFHEEHTT